MNLLFVANAISLAFLGLYLFYEKRNQLTQFFLVSNLGLAAWSLCIYIVEEQLFTDHVDLIARLQLIAAMCFLNGYFYLCISYPYPKVINKTISLVNLAVFLAFSWVLIFTDFITRAAIENGKVVYYDNTFGYVAYTAYLMFFCVASLSTLAQRWSKEQIYRSQIKYLFLGIGLFVLTGVICDLILPILGEYRFLPVGRHAAIFPPIFFSYVIIKHSFLDMKVIISSRLSWLVTILIMGFTATIGYYLTVSHPGYQFALMLTLVVLWGVAAAPLQRFLLTSAKRKFIRGWYSTEAVIAKIAAEITLDKSRESIFRTVEKAIDEVLEVESSLIIVSMRDESENFEYFKVAGQFQKIEASSPLMKILRQETRCKKIESLDDDMVAELVNLGLEKKVIQAGVLLPFQSPESLEGVLVIGERSNQQAYTAADLLFFNNLIAFISPVLYRLTPMEKLESLYFENRQKLHEAEIQLIRAQKIESIVHATRQCHHEIRTPLNIIKLGLGRIKSLDELVNFQRVAKEEIDHALEIVEETLTISDVNKNEVKRKTSVNINDVIRRCLRLIDTLQYKIALDLGEVPEITAYFSDMQVVITNLIHNAIDAMPQGGSLAFSTRATSESLIITVEDTGEGIPDDLKSKVWEPYFSGKISRVGNSTAGRGWGLTIVNRIVDEHGGTIRFISEPGSGTRFTITLPLPAENQVEMDNVISLNVNRRH